MKRHRLAVVALIAALVCSIIALRRTHAPAAHLAASEHDRSVAPPGRTGAPAAQPPGRRPPFRFTPALLAPATPAVEEPNEAPTPIALRARDGYYDRLLLKQGRDQAKEEQIFSRLTKTFGDSTDTLVGAVSCSKEFCRVELRGVGEVDVNQRWQNPLYAAVEPKGLKFFIVAEDDDGNTMTSCYFGRDDSFTVPDFHALGML